METKGFRYLATEVFETITGFNPNFMKKLYLRQNKMVKSNQMIFLVNNHNSTTNWNIRLLILIPKIWRKIHKKQRHYYANLRNISNYDLYINANITAANSYEDKQKIRVNKSDELHNMFSICLFLKHFISSDTIESFTTVFFCSSHREQVAA